MSVLYQKYRPKIFAEVVGQAHVVKTLQNAILQNRLSHAYLFCGSRGVGKTTLARILAKAVNCQNLKNGEPCLQCASCLAAESGGGFDIAEIDAASYTGVDNIREIIEQARLLPIVGKKRIYIIDEVHMLSKPAFNALLKTLEEPPSHALFILATTESQKVPETILSRVQRFDFFLHTQKDIVSQLQEVAKIEKITISDEVIFLIASAAAGGMRDALTLLHQVLTLGVDTDISIIRQSFGLPDRQKVLQMFELVITGDAEGLSNYFEELTQSGINIRSVIEDSLEVARLALTSKFLKNHPKEYLSPVLFGFSVEDLMHLMRLLLRAHKESSISPDPVLPLMLAAMEAMLKFSKSNKFVQAAKPEALGNLSSATEPEAFEQSNKESKIEITVPKAMEITQEDLKEGVSAANLDINTVRFLWPQICEKVAQVNIGLGNLVRQTNPTMGKISGQLVLTVRYDFHKKQLEQGKFLNTLRDAFLACGLAVPVFQVAVQKDLPEQEFVPSVAALRIFDGEVAE